MGATNVKGCYCQLCNKDYTQGGQVAWEALVHLHNWDTQPVRKLLTLSANQKIKLSSFLSEAEDFFDQPIRKHSGEARCSSCMGILVTPSGKNFFSLDMLRSHIVIDAFSIR